MATVEVLNKARMLAIEAASVVYGVISGDNLILVKHDGSFINAGNVRGPVGPAAVACRLYRGYSTSAQNLSNSTTTIVTGWGLVTGESSANPAEIASINVNGNITVLLAGLYTITFTVTFSTAATGGRKIAMLFKNDAEMRRQDVGSVDAQPATVEVVDTLKLAANDILTFRAYQSSGGALTLNRSPYHHFSILKHP